MRPFQVLVKPAAGDCNLACGYCFYRPTTPRLYPGADKPRMSRELMERLVKELLSYRFPETVFSWQGGEPTLMGLSFFEAAVEAQMKHGAAGQVVGNAFQTNGMLINRDWARFLAQARFVVGLSLDGPRSLHDRFRKSRGGEGTFAKVMTAAELLLEEGAAVNILCVVSRANEREPERVYRFFRAQGFHFIQFIPCLETDPRTGEVLPFSASPEGLAHFFRGFFQEYKRDGFPEVSERNLDAVISLHHSGKPNLCTFEKRCGSYLVVEHNGDIFPCDFFVAEEWRLGNLQDQPLHRFLERPLMKKFARAKEKVADECRECRWLSFCRGGCLKDRLPARAAAAGRSYFCRAYQELFETTERTVKSWLAELKAEERKREP